ncbi:hypothetical protein [Chryseobacterium taiwanense]|uniref:Uncharacterized protein n=1 Tax=Chryseobacterium taiwanense TaxID=363331 RepID=A0A0B4E406_9FLAO|nr:hypothetical protein [Chryseobacterium taiwanense]KIC61338.1 hypothetical protein RM51_17830 [Chryseobacterium taiwanense]
MNEHQKKLLVSLSRKKKEETSIEHPYDILIHSVLNTIDFEDLVNYHIDNEYTEFKSSIFSNIEKRVTTFSEHEKMYSSLKELLKTEVSYHKSIRIRIILELLLPQLTEDYKTDFFNTFFYSNYSHNNKAALRYLSFAETDVTDMLLDHFFVSGDTSYLNILLKQENAHLLTSNAEDLWFMDLSPYYKKRLIEICAFQDLEKFKFLRDFDYEFYMLLLLIRNEIKPNKIMSELEKMPEEKQHFALLNFSKWIDFSYVEKKVKKYL